MFKGDMRLKIRSFLRYMLAAAILSACFCACACAAESGFIFDAEQGYISGYTGTDTNVVIPDTIGDVKVIAVGLSEGDCSGIQSLTIPAGVTSVDVMSGCGNLESVYFAEGSNLESIWKDAFAGLKKLRTIVLPDSVDYMGESAFKGCIALKNINIPSRMTYVPRYAFAGCTSLGSITIPESVTKINEYAFAGCSSLGSVAMNDGTTWIDHYAFAGCTSLAEIMLPEALEYLSMEAFTGCEKLTVLLYEGSYAHDCCLADGLNHRFILENGSSAFIVDENGVITACGQMDQVVIPAKVGDVTVTGLGQKLFYTNAHITSVSFEEGSRVSSIGVRAFYGCTALTGVEFPASLTSIGNYAFYGCTALEAAEIPAGVSSVSSYAFYECTKIESLSLHKDITSIGKCAFWGCSSLESVSIAEGSAMRTIGDSAFASCTKLKGFEIPEGVTGIGSSAFASTFALEEIYIPKSVQTIGSSAFMISGLKSVVYDEESGVDTIAASTFAGCAGIETLLLPPDLQSIDERAFEEIPGSNAYEGVIYVKTMRFPNNISLVPGTICENLTDIIISEGTMEIPKACFLDGYGDMYMHLKSLTLPSSLVTIGDQAFRSCRALKEIHFPENSALKTIGSEAFRWTALRELVLPEGLETIGAMAFLGCSALADALIEGGDFPVMGDQAFPSGLVVKLKDGRNFIVGTPENLVETMFNGWEDAEFAFASADSSVLAIENGVASPLKTGTSRITVSVHGMTLEFDARAAELNIADPLVLPGNIERILEEAFVGTTVQKIVLPDSVKSVGSRAFADSEDLLVVEVPRGIKLPDDALENSPDARIIYR